MEEQLDPVRGSALGAPLLGSERRVAVDGGEVMREVAVRVVLELVAQLAGRPLQID